MVSVEHAPMHVARQTPIDREVKRRSNICFKGMVMKIVT